MPREEIMKRINELQVMRWKLLSQPEISDYDVRPAALDWISSTIAEHQRDLAAIYIRKAG